jgi:hypothetical protein
MADVTTMKISVQTRDRLRALASVRQSLEDVVVAALDVYEAERFWAEAEASAVAETVAQRQARRHREDAIDRWMDSLT